MTKTILISLPVALALAGCAIGPDYRSPSLSVPPSFVHTDGNATRNDHVAIDRAWWKNFGDAGLGSSVERGLAGNYDLAIAQAQTEAFLGQFDQAKSYLYPHINGAASFDRKNVENSSGMPNLPNGLRSTFAASLAMASYEIDLFGKVRRATEAARATLLAGTYNQRAVQLSVTGGIAASYIRLASYRDQIALASDNLRVTQNIEKLTKLRYDIGTVSQSEWLTSLSQVDGARASLAQLEGGRIAEESTYHTLIGENFTDVTVSPLSAILLPEVPAGLPSTVLTSRPDVREAEQALIAANARIGVAYGSYFPTFSLTGMLGVQTSDLSRLLSSPARIWQFTPALNVPLFGAGYASGQVREAEATRDQALALYKKAVVSALNDADSALGQYRFAKDQVRASAERAASMQQAFAQAKLRYDKGMISFTDLLTVQQTWLSARQQEVTSRQSALIAAVSLYKALGGGWDERNLPELPGWAPAGLK